MVGWVRRGLVGGRGLLVRGGHVGVVALQEVVVGGVVGEGSDPVAVDVGLRGMAEEKGSLRWALLAGGEVDGGTC